MIYLNPLPNKNVVGSFNPFDQVIHLGGFSSDDVNQRMSGLHAERWKKSFPFLRTLYHEYTHFLDMTTTTYGLTVLSSIYGGAAAYTQNANPLDDARAQEARKYINELSKDEAHSRVSGSCRKQWHAREWYANARTHVNDKDHVLTGTIFIDPDTKEEFAHAAFSLISMLESNAVANEILFCEIYGRSTHALKTEVLKHYEDLTREYKEFIYNENFVQYSVCFHRCAKAVVTEDIIVASRVCAVICEICLDVSLLTLANVDPPDFVLSDLTPELRARIIDEIKGGSRPLLFYMLTSILEKEVVKPSSQDDLFEFLIKYAGISNFEVNAQQAKSAMFRILQRRNISNQQYNNFIKIIENNLSLKKTASLFDFTKYVLPPVMLSDGAVFDLSKFSSNKKIMNFDPIEHALWMRGFQNWL